MTKWQIYLLMLACMILPATAMICDDTVTVNKTCSVVTPTLSCSQYNYTLVNDTGSLISSGSLTNLYDDIYYYNLSTELEIGDYVHILCDDTTRELHIVNGEDDRMIMAALIIAPLLFGLILILAINGLGEDHAILKWFLFLLVFITFISSLHFGLLAVVKFYDYPELQDVIGSTTYWVGIVFFIVIIYFLIYFVKLLFDIAAQKKREKLEYG